MKKFKGGGRILIIPTVDRLWFNVNVSISRHLAVSLYTISTINRVAHTFSLTFRVSLFTFLLCPNTPEEVPEDN